MLSHIHVDVCYFTKTRSNLLWFWWLQNLAVHTNTYMLHDQLFLILSYLFFHNAIALPVLKFILKHFAYRYYRNIIAHIFYGNYVVIRLLEHHREKNQTNYRNSRNITLHLISCTIFIAFIWNFVNSVSCNKGNTEKRTFQRLWESLITFNLWIGRKNGNPSFQSLGPGFLG